MKQVTAVLLAFVAVLCGPQAFAGVRDLVPLDAIVRLEDSRAGSANIRLEGFTLDGNKKTLILEEFSVFAPGAVIEVFDGDLKPTRVKPVSMRQFRGRIEGEPESLVYLSTGGHSDGLIIDRDRKYIVSQRRSSAGRQFLVEEVSLLDELDTGKTGYTCEALQTPVSAIEGLVPRSLAAGLTPTPEGALPTATATTVLNLALSTDSALYANFGNNAAGETALRAWVQNLIGAASVIYSRDLRTELRISYLQVTTTSDPWAINPFFSSGVWNGVPGTAHTTSHALAEFGDYWHNTPPSANPRSATMLLSGQDALSGINWVNVICDGDFLCANGNCGSVFDGHWGGSYGYCGGLALDASEQIVPDPNINSGGAIPYQVTQPAFWGLMQFSHELGHGVQSPHTHCIGLTAGEKTQYGVSRDWVDECFTSGGCFGGTTVVPAEKGTIMSYCHMRAGGETNLRWLFGKLGEPSAKVLTSMRAALDAESPDGLTPITAAASVTQGVASPASVTSAAGLSFDWTITNGTFAGGGTTATGASVTFTATTPNPVTLRVYGTNSQGCSVSDFKTVAVTPACLAPAITGQPASAIVTSGATNQLTVTASGAGLSYQWYTGASGNTASPIGGATSATLSVAPVVTTSYWVRVTNSCGSVDSATATFTVAAAAGAASTFNLVTPCRIVDTRNAVGATGGPSLASGVTRTLAIGGALCGIPADARSVAVNLTALGAGSNGWMTLFPGGSSLPLASTINYSSGTVRANNAVVPLSVTGTLNVNNSGPSATHFILDVTGYFK